MHTHMPTRMPAHMSTHMSRHTSLHTHLHACPRPFQWHISTVSTQSAELAAAHAGKFVDDVHEAVVSDMMRDRAQVKAEAELASAKDGEEQLKAEHAAALEQLKAEHGTAMEKLKAEAGSGGVRLAGSPCDMAHLILDGDFDSFDKETKSNHMTADIAAALKLDPVRISIGECMAGSIIAQVVVIVCSV